MDTVTTVFIAVIACLPSAVTGFCFWLIQQKIQKESKKREAEEAERARKEKKREELREQQELFLVKGISAAISLGKATARAVGRIPDAHCNGDMKAALEYADKVTHEQREFLAKQGIIQLFEE
ncbi:MAG: serine/threonine protein kinase [Clostridia bacterium]|nr:serine/threonine protein kinase [Clostridia bacterium]